MAERRMAPENSFPIAHALLAVVGLEVPPEVGIAGDFLSERGVRVAADELVVTPDTQVVSWDGTLYLMSQRNPGVKGKVSCVCSGGGGCDILKSMTPSGRPSVKCVNSDCSGRCGIAVLVPIDKVAALALEALDIQVEPGHTVVGDLVRGAVLTGGGLRLGDRCPFTVEQGEDIGYFVSRDTGVTEGDFDCNCPGEKGGCRVVVGSDDMFCESEGCKGNCEMSLSLPSLQLQRTMG